MTLAVAAAAPSFPDLDPQPLDAHGLSARDTSLALAIHRTVMQRWITLEFLLNLRLKQPLSALEPMLQAVLLVGAGQLVFLDRLPAHAVVDEMVTLAKSLVRPGAGAMTNAVLRQIAGMIDRHVHDNVWHPADDRLPLIDGYVPLRESCLPDPHDLSQHLAIVSSRRQLLVEHWLKNFGHDTTLRLCQHDLQTPPTIVVLEANVTPSMIDGFDAQAHGQPGFLVWRDTHDKLVQFLAGHPSRRVQDPASAKAVQAVSMLRPVCVLDLCAGRGTKTRQMAAQWPDAIIIATDTDAHRFSDLQRVFADHDRVTVLKPRQACDQARLHGVDLLLLDVPCSNTGVLARRPQAKYRYSDNSIASVVRLQREIIQSSIDLVRTGGHVLYCTCSIDPRENQQQAHWIIQCRAGSIIDESLTMPTGRDTTYHDGQYHALIQFTAK